MYIRVVVNMYMYIHVVANMYMYIRVVVNMYMYIRVVFVFFVQNFWLTSLHLIQYCRPFQS